MKQSQYGGGLKVEVKGPGDLGVCLICFYGRYPQTETDSIFAVQAQPLHGAGGFNFFLCDLHRRELAGRLIAAGEAAEQAPDAIHYLLLSPFEGDAIGCTTKSGLEDVLAEDAGAHYREIRREDCPICKLKPGTVEEKFGPDWVKERIKLRGFEG